MIERDGFTYRDADHGDYFRRFYVEACSGDDADEVPRVVGRLAEYLWNTLLVAGLRPPLSLLDVGARFGSLETVCPDGVSYEGIDPNPVTTARAQALGRNVHAGPPRHASYDLIVCRFVCQFLDDVPGFLSSLVEGVSPGGALALIQAPSWSLDEPRHFNGGTVDACMPWLAPIDVVYRGRPVSDSEDLIVAVRPAR